MFFKSFMAIACTSFVVATSARAQEFPSKHVTLMMPYAAGGPGDTLTRIIGQGMGKVLGRVFLVENVAGAGGTLGTAKVAASAPDGYSLLVMHFGHAANTALYRNLRRPDQGLRADRDDRGIAYGFRRQKGFSG